MRGKLVLAAMLFAAPFLLLFSPANASAWPPRYFRPAYGNYALAYQNAARMAAYQNAMRAAMYRNAMRATANRSAMRADTLNNRLRLSYGPGNIPRVSPTLGSNPALVYMLTHRNPIFAVGGSLVLPFGGGGGSDDDNGDSSSN